MSLGFSYCIQAKAESKGEIKIGYTSSLVGGNRPQTLDVVNGAKIAINEINAAGGVLGRKLKLVFLDNANVQHFCLWCHLSLPNPNCFFASFNFCLRESK